MVNGGCLRRADVRVCREKERERRERLNIGEHTCPYRDEHIRKLHAQFSIYLWASRIYPNATDEDQSNCASFLHIVSPHQHTPSQPSLKERQRLRKPLGLLKQSSTICYGAVHEKGYATIE